MSETSPVKTMCHDFRKCMRAFSYQDAVARLLNEEKDELHLFIRDSQSGEYRVVDSHPLLNKDYPQAVWSVDALADEFLRCYPQYKVFSEVASREIRHNMAVRLAEHFEAALPDVDMDVITAIGGERYESAAGTGLAMAMIPFPLTPEWLNSLGLDGTTLFKPEARLRLSIENIHSLRKQLNLAKEASLAVCHMPSAEGDSMKEGLYSVGILPKQARDIFPHIHFTGHMEWCFCVPEELESHFDGKCTIEFFIKTVRKILAGGKRKARNAKGLETDEAKMKRQCRLRYRQGHLLIPEIDPTKVYKENLHIEEKYRESVIKLIRLARTQKKGAILIVSDTDLIQQECDRLCSKYNRGLRFQDSFSLFADDGETMRRYTSIDGAVFVDFEGNCYACGVILDGAAMEKGDMGRGARYNSTTNYLKVLRDSPDIGNREIVGIVVSEDGMVNILD